MPLCRVHNYTETKSSRSGVHNAPARFRRQKGSSVTTPVAPNIPTDGQIVMYSTTWCGYCRRLKTQLDSVGIGYTEINIEEVPGTAEYVEAVNGGNQVVPTVVFPDGTSATNPSLNDVKARLGL